MSRWHVNVIFAYFLEHLSMLRPKNIPHNMTPGENRIFILRQQPVRFYLVGSHGVTRVLDPFLHNLHHSSKNLWVRRFLDEGGEDDLDEVLPHFHVHDWQPLLYQIQTKHDQLARHYSQHRRTWLHDCNTIFPFVEVHRPSMIFQT